MGRKHRPGFADLHVTRASFRNDEARCPTCHRHIGESDNPKLIATFGSAEPSLATLTCERCRTMLSIRFVES